MGLCYIYQVSENLEEFPVTAHARWKDTVGTCQEQSETKQDMVYFFEDHAFLVIAWRGHSVEGVNTDKDT